MQVLLAARCTKAGSAPLLSNVNLVHGGAQMHRYFYQFIRKKVITMWRQVTPTPRYSGSSLILVPAHTSALLHSRYHIPLRQDTVVAHFLYKRRAEPIKQLHVPRQQQERLCCQTGNGNQISTISTPRYAVILPSWPPCLSVINRY